MFLEGFLVAPLGGLHDSSTLSQELTSFVKFRQELTRFDTFFGPAEKWSEGLLDLPGSPEDVPRRACGAF